MAQVLVRNLPDDVVEKLRARAARHGRSLEAELRSVLEEVATADLTALREQSRAIRKKLEGRYRSDSTALIREDRDR